MCCACVPVCLCACVPVLGVQVPIQLLESIQHGMGAVVTSASSKERTENFQRLTHCVWTDPGHCVAA